MSLSLTYYGDMEDILRTCTHTYTQSHTDTHTHTHTHTPTHGHTHTHTQTSTHAYTGSVLIFVKARLSYNNNNSKHIGMPL